MIPKKIHYFWFGESEKPKMVLDCINSWKKYCPDYEIIEWNEKNYDVHKNKYMEQAYTAKRWGFVSDYARLDVIYEHGGLYFDTDVEIVKPLDELMNIGGFIGFEKNVDTVNQNYYVNTGQGFGATNSHPVIKQMLDVYAELQFFENNKENLTTCPYYNTIALIDLGLRQDNIFQKLGDFVVYPSDYFCPINWKTKKIEKTDNTYTIHYFNASWLSEKEKKQRKKERMADYIVHLPNIILKKFLGNDRYQNLKNLLKRIK